MMFDTVDLYTFNYFPTEMHLFQVYQTFQCTRMEAEPSIILRAQILGDIVNPGSHTGSSHLNQRITPHFSAII